MLVFLDYLLEVVVDAHLAFGLKAYIYFSEFQCGSCDRE